MMLVVLAFSWTTAVCDWMRGGYEGAAGACSGDRDRVTSLATGSGSVMVGMVKLGRGLWTGGAGGAGRAVLVLSNRGFSGLRAIAGSGNLISGEREPSGDSDSPRVGCGDVDMRWAFLSSPSPMRLFLCVPPLDVVRVVYSEPLSCP